jgi:hypothetical protein
MSVFTQPGCYLAHRLQSIGSSARPLTNGRKPPNGNNVTSTYKNSRMSYCPSSFGKSPLMIRRKAREGRQNYYSSEYSWSIIREEVGVCCRKSCAIDLGQQCVCFRK